MRKARLLCLVDKYENELISSTGKHKGNYVGNVGKVVHKQKVCETITQMIIYMTLSLMMVLDFVYVESRLNLLRYINNDLFYCRILFR